MSAGAAWYHSDRAAFLASGVDVVVGRLSSAAIQSGLHIEPEQREEWLSSVGLLQRQLADRVELVRKALAAPDLAAFTDVVLEFDFRRRGLRIDCVLLGEGIIAVIEFKKSALTSADRDQVTNYCINLVEFHEETRRLCADEGCVVVPLLALTDGERRGGAASDLSFHNPPWNTVVRRPIEADADTLAQGLRLALGARNGGKRVSLGKWLGSRFAPSSSIVDAAISLYGDHDVAAITHHSAPVKLIADCTEAVATSILRSESDRKHRIIFVSGSPGAGKTLVGLKLAFDSRFREDAVFVTGNAPLVDVLCEALKGSYQSGAKRRSAIVKSGYARADAQQVIRMASFKIVKAHTFLGERGKGTGSADGRIVIFDEAQRTYAKGREVLRTKLKEDEAELILKSLEESYPGKGAVVVALVGHNQAINRGEEGIGAWFKAAAKRGWLCTISEATLDVVDPSGESGWGSAPNRERLAVGHLPHSLRYYRNATIEQWVDAVMTERAEDAASIASNLVAQDTIWLTRDLARAREWARRERVGEERAGIIASSNARRLAADGLFIELKPNIADWMLRPTGDLRSSNSLETVQNQFQVQGLEVDYAIVCWDGDLRRVAEKWKAFKINGDRWQADTGLVVATNRYRVLLTRARKGMTIFVPRGDATCTDPTRPTEVYDEVANYLQACGAKPLP